MKLGVITIFAIFFLSPPIAVEWKGADNNAFKLAVDLSDDPCTADLLDSGFTIKYRYKVRACRPRSSWGSDCGRNLTEIRNLRYDPVVEKFKVAVDRLNDEFEPRSITFDTKEEALHYVSAIDDFTIAELQARTPEIPIKRSNDMFIRVRVDSECRGSFREVVSWIPYLFTLGIVERDQFDTGWIDFYLR